MCLLYAKMQLGHSAKHLLFNLIGLEWHWDEEMFFGIFIKALTGVRGELLDSVFNPKMHFGMQSEHLLHPESL